jgi:hypothetical protein
MDPNPAEIDDAETFRLEHPSTLWVGAKAYPAQVYSVTKEYSQEELGEWALYRRQARVWFENRWGLSVIWGSGTYSTNDYYRLDIKGLPFVEEPTTVEIGLLYDDGLVSDVVGYLPPAVVRLVLDDVAQWSSVPNQEIPVRWRSLDRSLVRLLDAGDD